MEENEAVAEVLNALISFVNSDEEELEIVTGNGIVLTRVVEELVEEEGLLYFHRNNNTGKYIIKK